MALIEFFCESDIIDAIPHPVPARKVMPDWYKKMPQDRSTGLDFMRTAKMCIPLRDCLTSGYIIPLWEDMRIQTTDMQEPDHPTIRYKWTRNVSKDNQGAISNHNPKQTQEMPITDTPLGDVPLKFNSPWIIRTPPGYSCLFTMPFNRYDQNFEILSAIVDTDQYFNKISFPFIWLKPGICETLEKGTPLVQVTPFKRTEWNSKIKPITEKEKSLWTKVNNQINTVWKHGYRTTFWSKKKYS